MNLPELASARLHLRPLAPADVDTLHVRVTQRLGMAFERRELLQGWETLFYSLSRANVHARAAAD